MTERKNKDPRLLEVWPQIVEAFGTDDVKVIAERMNVAKSTVYEWRKGSALLLDNLYAISDETGYSIHYLLTAQGQQNVEPRTGLFVELNDFQKQEIKRIARSANVTAEEQITRIIIWALLFFEVMTQKQPSQSTFESVIKWMHDLAEGQPVESQIRNTR